jgi:NAD(P)-dependent dehydrogenase (short-subunit alcohol dehydrogenase family)
MAMELDLTGRRVLVTGGGQGVGRGIALGFATAGAEVTVNDVSDERASAVVDEIRLMGGSAVSSVFDVTDYAAVTRAVEDLGGVDILVNNAGNAGAGGWPGRGKFVETEPTDRERYLQVNLYGVMYCARAALPGMITKGWGRVITIVSDAGRTGDANMAAYSAAKAGAAGSADRPQPSLGVENECADHDRGVVCPTFGTLSDAEPASASSPASAAQRGDRAVEAPSSGLDPRSCSSEEARGSRLTRRSLPTPVRHSWPRARDPSLRARNAAADEGEASAGTRSPPRWSRLSKRRTLDLLARS